MLPLALVQRNPSLTPFPATGFNPITTTQTTIVLACIAILANERELHILFPVMKLLERTLHKFLQAGLAKENGIDEELILSRLCMLRSIHSDSLHDPLNDVLGRWTESLPDTFLQVGGTSASGCWIT